MLSGVINCCGVCYILNVCGVVSLSQPSWRDLDYPIWDDP